MGMRDDVNRIGEEVVKILEIMDSKVKEGLKIDEEKHKIYPIEVGSLLAIRYMGATRGYIEFKNCIITKVRIYKDSNIYEESLQAELINIVKNTKIEV